MGRGSSGNVTGPRGPSGGGLPLGHAGAASHSIGGVERYYKVHGEPESASQAARLQGPRLRVHTDLTPIEGISRALLTMSRVGFDIVTHFRGPVTDPSPERKEGMHVRDVVTALASQSSSRMPLLGLKAVLKYRRDGRVKAIVRVGRKQPVNIAIRVKGAVFKSDWYGLKKLVARKLADLDRYE